MCDKKCEQNMTLSKTKFLKVLKSKQYYSKLFILFKSMKQLYGV